MAAAAQNLPSSLLNLDPGPRLVDGKGLSDAISGSGGRSSQNAITASTTQTQVGGTVLLANISRITVANASDAVTLGFAAVPGAQFQIINDSGQTFQLFPKLGDKLNDAAVNAAITIADNTSSIYGCPVAGNWFGGPVSLET